MTMIIDNLKYSEKYESVHKDFKEAFDFLKTLTKDTPAGSFASGNISGFITEMIETSDMSKGKPKAYEAHEKAIDIHFVIEGGEDDGVAIIDNLTPTCDYNDEKDYRFYDGRINRMPLREGDFLIAFPEDGHIPAMVSDDVKQVKRAVVKIKI